MYFLIYLRPRDNFDVLNGFENGAQAFVVKEGFYHLAQRVAEELRDAIMMEAPVGAISQDSTGVSVRVIREPHGRIHLAGTETSTPRSVLDPRMPSAWLDVGCAPLPWKRHKLEAGETAGLTDEVR